MSERAVSTIFPPYIMPNGTYERIKKIYDTLPLSHVAWFKQMTLFKQATFENQGAWVSPVYIV